MNTVNLTARQQKFFDYFNSYYQQNGAFPTLSQGARDMNVNVGTISSVYGALLVKGAFTDGKAIVAGNKARRNTSAVRAVNLAELKIQPKAKLRKTHTPKAIAQAIAKLIASSDPNGRKLAALLGL